MRKINITFPHFVAPLPDRFITRARGPADASQSLTIIIVVSNWMNFPARARAIAAKDTHLTTVIPIIYYDIFFLVLSGIRFFETRYRLGSNHGISIVMQGHFMKQDWHVSKLALNWHVKPGVLV